MHSHLLPGIDDGAKTLEDSLRMITELASFGYKKLVTTPHILSGLYNNTSEIIKKQGDLVAEALVRQDIDIDLEYSAEYFTDHHFEELIAKKDLLPFGDNYILFELGFMNEPPQMQKVIFDLQMAGYRPILAHPERYNYWHQDFSKFEEVIARGVSLQLNINSLTGQYGPGVQKTAERLIEENLITFLGTDCHHDGHLHMMGDMIYHPLIGKLIESGMLKNASI